ncbi:hypothetical protein AYL99_02353 [Fonsecaea erecta]|uniref:XPG-I domain-containing protein n=1 Tax=Fonsecaea erecta TaxID=1367422 RepID=A0A178ZUG4_9EURO|nr:hypothetical protein AYL99_02353 [Fonsecaea erecta]OAP63126.1 hypothetical protein AYL99_02353 [Fonsecaea erecta]
MSKGLISLFQFPTHVAPGEAEAECAMLQREGVVDAVMTQDVDALMFGSGLTLRDWSKEANGKKGNKTPTHVSVLDLPRVKNMCGLDPEGMILVALLSGGDYDEDGVAGIGCKLACEIARAGFGSDLVELVRNGDEDGITEWRERLQFELETNESGYFKMKRKSVRIPDSFPNRKILGYYMNPAVTPVSEMERLERKWAKTWDEEIDVQALRDYAADMFEWLYKPGAWKFVRVMAPALLADGLRRDRATSHLTSVDQITEQRQHFVSDGIPELRVTVVPAKVVGLNLDAEEDSPTYLQLLAEEENEGAEGETEHAEIDENAPLSPSKKRKSPAWLPDAPEKMWIAQTIVEIGAREHVEQWKRIQFENANDPKKLATRKCPKKKESKKPKVIGGMQPGALLSYVVPADQSTELEVSIAVPIKSPRRRAGANISAPRRSKPKSSKLEEGYPPTMLGFFKSTKGSQPSHSTMPARDAASYDLVKPGAGNDDDPLTLSNESRGDKHPRPSTSSPPETGQRIGLHWIKAENFGNWDTGREAIRQPNERNDANHLFAKPGRF